MSKKEIYAYIDGQNLHSGVKALGWKLDHNKFRDFLEKKLNVTKAYFFIGFMEEHQDLYSNLQESGYILVFKPLIRTDNGEIKGNVDADMVLHAMIDIENYDQAVIVSGDGDFAGLIRHLAGRKKLKQVVIPNKRTFSSLYERLEEYGKGYFTYVENHKKDLSYSVYRGKSPKNNKSPQNKNSSQSRSTSKSNNRQNTKQGFSSKDSQSK